MLGMGINPQGRVETNYGGLGNVPRNRGNDFGWVGKLAQGVWNRIRVGWIILQVPLEN